MSLHDIGVRIEDGEPERLLGGIRPLLREIEALLAVLVETGRGGSIDLRSLPMSPAEREALDSALGEGEVQARVHALGETQVRETAVHGVWRVTHRDAGGHALADLIEVCRVPGILETHEADIGGALTAFRSRLAAEG